MKREIIGLGKKPLWRGIEDILGKIFWNGWGTWYVYTNGLRRKHISDFDARFWAVERKGILIACILHLYSGKEYGCYCRCSSVLHRWFLVCVEEKKPMSVGYKWLTGDECWNFEILKILKFWKFWNFKKCEIKKKWNFEIFELLPVCRIAIAGLLLPVAGCRLPGLVKTPFWHSFNW